MPVPDGDGVNHHAISMCVDHIDQHAEHYDHDLHVVSPCVSSSSLAVHTLVPDEGRSHWFSNAQQTVSVSDVASSAATIRPVISGSTTQLRSKVATNLTWLGSSARLRTYLERGQSSSECVTDGPGGNPASNLLPAVLLPSRSIPGILPPAKRRREDHVFLESAVEAVRFDERGAR